MPDCTVIQVKATVQSPRNSKHLAERQILLIECKRPSYDTVLGWHDTIIGQFEDDLSATLNASEKLFGAVAIGTKVRFYRFDGKKTPGQTLEQLHQDTIDMAEPSGIAEVERWMNYIKANAWQWASS